MAVDVATGAAIEEATVKTFEDARAYVKRVGICHILGDGGGNHNSLWLALDAPEKQPGEGGWGDKMNKVWTWKDTLPDTYPDEIFYGKIKGGRAILCTIDMLRDLYAVYHKSLIELSAEARKLYEIVQREPTGNPHLRATANMAAKESKSRYERALTELQVALYIARVIDRQNESWFWDTFARRYPQIAGEE